MAHLGFLFFGTITTVEQTIRELIEGPSWHKNPIQFLVVDLTLVAGVDMSSAEAFVRIQRLLFAKGAVLVFCGFTPESLVGKALRNVDVLGTEGVELFTAFNDAMECACFCASLPLMILDALVIPQGPKMRTSDLGTCHTK